MTNISSFIAKSCFFILFLLYFEGINAQNTQDSIQIRRIYNESLTNPKAYHWLEYLCKKIGGRLAGSPQSQAAVEFTKQILDTLGLDKVYLQEVMVPHWVRGEKETAKILNSKRLGNVDFRVCALGNSVGTGEKGVVAEVIEVNSLEALEKLGTAKIQGKIVFFNRPMDATLIRTFEAYGKAGEYRRSGPSEAAKYGAIGVIVRSLTTRIDDFPHTGSLNYKPNIAQIPAIAISTKGANLLSSILRDEPKLQFYFQTNCQKYSDKLSYNVIGEIKGSQFPDEIMVVGGHLDSWDTGEGAHDDGAGCVQSMEVLRLFKSLNIKPKRTIRCVLFANEENGLRGGRKYAEVAEERKENHIAAIESDAGGFVPRSLGVSEDKGKYEVVKKWEKLFEEYMVEIVKGGGGADISPLRSQGTILMSLQPDSQRYFDYHHTEIDTFDKVNLRELQLGAAAMASLLYLIAEYGL